MRKSIVIICDGKFPKSEYPRYLIRTADMVICCDGALKKYLRHAESIFGEKRLPDAVIGDMDSLSAGMQQKYASIIIKVDEQENNDQTKAFTWVMENIPAIGDIYILGATGGREDHTIGNISLLMEYAKRWDLVSLGINVSMITDHGTLFAITDSFEMECGSGRAISIFSPDNELRIHSEGLAWKTDDVIFDNWWKASLNRSDKDRVRLEFSKKSVALIMMD